MIKSCTHHFADPEPVAPRHELSTGKKERAVRLVCAMCRAPAVVCPDVQGVGAFRDLVGDIPDATWCDVKAAACLSVEPGPSAPSGEAPAVDAKKRWGIF